MSPHYCLAPDNTDITGIGVRTSLYAQSLLIVIISSVAKAKNRSPDSVAGLWRLQFYTAFAFVVAGIVQRANGQLSLFHETAALHLGILTISSAVVGIMTEAVLPTSQPAHIGNDRFGRPAYMLTSHSLTTQLVIKAGYPVLSIVCSVLVLVETCVASPGNPDSDYPNLTWIFLFAIRLHGATGEEQGGFSLLSVGLPFLTFAFAAIGWVLFLLFNIIKKRFWKRKGLKWTKEAREWGLVLGYVMFWVEEVVAIESSLKANPGLNREVENAWQFGQIIPLVLLIPFLESLKEQLTARDDTDIDHEDIGLPIVTPIPTRTPTLEPTNLHQPLLIAS